MTKMLEEVKHCKKIMEKHFQKSLSYVKKIKYILEKLVNFIYVINYIINKILK